MLKSSSIAQHVLSLFSVKLVQIREPLIENTRQTNEALSTPTTKGIAHYAVRLGYATNHQCFWVLHAENP